MMISEQQQIDEILTEAGTYYRRDEVIELATTLRELTSVELVESYEVAFNRLVTLDIKNYEEF